MKARLTFAGARALSPTLALLAALAVVACVQKPAAPRAVSRGEAAVARVNGAPVWTEDVTREAAAQGLIAPGEALDPGSDLFRQVLDEVVDERLLAAEAVHRGLDRAPAARRRLDAARDRVLADLVLQGTVDKAVTAKAIDALYREMLANRAPGEAPPSPQAARPQIVRFLTFDQVKDLVLNLRRAARVEILPPAAAPAPASLVPAVQPAPSPPTPAGRK